MGPIDAKTSEYVSALAALERALTARPEVEIKNHERLRQCPHPHTAAMCRAIAALIHGFPQNKIVVLVEAEVAASGRRSRPEDIVAWVERAGVFVLEIKSHSIAGIRRFENNIPVVVYNGNEAEDVHLIDQPRKFAYELRAQIELEFEKADQTPPALYWAGWLPNVTAREMMAQGQQVDASKVWLSTMGEGSGIASRLKMMNNLTKPAAGADRNGLAIFLNIFGCTAGLRAKARPRATMPGTLGYTIDCLNNQLRRLTHEQEELAFSPQLLRGPKVIRGVAGSGKTVVLANAVANLLLETMRHNTEDMLALAGDRRSVRVLVLCYNRALVPYLDALIKDCFNALKPESDWAYPADQVHIINKDRLFYRLTKAYCVGEYTPGYGNDNPLLKKFCEVALDDVDQYSHVFIDEGQDIDQEWYPFITGLARKDPEVGPSIVVFYDEAQNIYGVRRPGTAGQPSWRDLISADVSRRGLRTVMRVGHRNTNEILSFSFNMLLGAFAARDPQMAQFAELNAYTQEEIPNDPMIDHPYAGKPCVERIGPRRYQINFAVRSGPWPQIHPCAGLDEMARELASTIKRQIAPDGEMVDPRNILVMAPTRATVIAIAGELRKAGIKVHTPISAEYDCDRRQTDPRDMPLFQPGTITVGTIHSAKGHTAAICHLAALEQLEWDPTNDPPGSEQTRRAEFHVAATRATYQLEIWGQECGLMDEARKVLAFLSRPGSPNPASETNKIT